MLEGDAVYDDLVLTAQCIVENTERYAEIAAYLKGSGKVTFATGRRGITRRASPTRFPLRRFCEGIRIAPLRSTSAASLFGTRRMSRTLP